MLNQSVGNLKNGFAKLLYPNTPTCPGSICTSPFLMFPMAVVNSPKPALIISSSDIARRMAIPFILLQY